MLKKGKNSDKKNEKFMCKEFECSRGGIYVKRVQILPPYYAIFIKPF